jgi:hypothetical protein
MRRISFLILFACSAQAGNFCGTRDIGKISEDPAMRMGFKNAGGLANGGVCWWHSRFQRAAWYLAEFDPGAPAPSVAAAKDLIRRLVSRSEVVVIPGYGDLVSFTKDFKPEIQSALNAWQLRDAFLNQAYLRGLHGQARFREASAMKARLDKVFAEFTAAATTGDVLWVMLQMPGIYSHASLIHTMESSPDGGYRIAMVDSNFPGKFVEYVYRPGDLDLFPANVKVGKGYASVPYSGFSRDLRRIHGALARYCSTPLL